MSWLDRIREKSEGERARYLFAAVGVSFSFVLVVWFFSLKTSVLGITDGSQDGFDGLRQFREDVGPPPSLDGLLQAGESLQELIRLLVRGFCHWAGMLMEVMILRLSEKVFLLKNCRSTRRRILAL